MAKVSVLNVAVLENPSPFHSPFRFEISFECSEALADGEAGPVWRFPLPPADPDLPRETTDLPSNPDLPLSLRFSPSLLVETTPDTPWPTQPPARGHSSYPCGDLITPLFFPVELLLGTYFLYRDLSLRSLTCRDLQSPYLPQTPSLFPQRSPSITLSPCEIPLPRGKT